MTAVVVFYEVLSVGLNVLVRMPKCEQLGLLLIHIQRPGFQMVSMLQNCALLIFSKIYLGERMHSSKHHHGIIQRMSSVVFSRKSLALFGILASGQ